MSTVANVHSSQTVEVNPPLVNADGTPRPTFTRRYYDGLPAHIKDMYHLVRYTTIAGSAAIDYTFQHREDAPQTAADPAAAAERETRRIAGPYSEDAPIRQTPLNRLIPRPEPDWFLEYQRRERENNQQLHADNARLRRTVQELESAILNQKHEQTRALSIYGSPNALEEVTRQVAMAPQYKDLNTDEHRYVAGIGLASGLNPVFHLHAWISEDYNKKTKKKERMLHVTPDYKALIVSAPDPIMTKERRLTVDEMTARGIPQTEIDAGAIAYVVEGYNLKLAIMARQAGLEYEPKRGYGWWSAVKVKEVWATKENGDRYNTGKTEVTPNDVPTARDGEWVARKRAFRDLFNQLADLRLKYVAPAGGRVQDDEWVMGDAVDEPAPTIIEGEFTETPAPAARPDWLTPEGENRAATYMLKQGVSDEEINFALGVPNWRETPITADEWKAVVDKIALQSDMEAGVLPTDEPQPAPENEIVTLIDMVNETAQKLHEAQVSSPESAESEQEPTPAETLNEWFDPKDTGEAPAPAKCANCGLEDADLTSPFPTLCKGCGNAEANRQAAKAKA